MTGPIDRLAAALADRYRIERELGQGGMATVYLAQDLKHHRQVAIKVLRPELAAALGADRFLREIETTANLQHPHILPLFDSGQSDGFLYYVMPYVDGETLRARLARAGPLTIAEVTQFTSEIADALAKAHKAGVVHRDIKPENVFLADGHALVLDFGVAKALSEANSEQGLTTAGVSLGTPAYMAPEQVAADPHIDHRADLYALGLVAYEMLVGGSPYAATTPQQQMAAHISQAPAPVLQKRPDCPPALAALVMRCLEKEPDKRWATADEVVTQLRAIETYAPTHAASNSTRRITMVAGAALLAIVAVWALRSSRQPVSGAASSGVLAVLPFTVRGSAQFAYLGEGVVDLLSASLDGASGIRSVNAHALLGFVGHDAAAMSVERARDVAAHFNASQFVVGDVLEVGGKLRLSASLFDRDNTTRPLAEATVDGEPADVLSLVDLLATRLVAEKSADRGARLSRTAAVTTSSLPALKAYLAGEQAYRAGQYAVAATSFKEAVAADTAFALAFHRLGMAQERIASTNEAQRSAELALERSGRLSVHDRRFLEAVVAMRRGQSGDAEQQFRSIIETWPDDAEAWYLQGELLFHGNPLQGASFTRAEEPFSRALFLDPGDLGAIYHLVRIAAGEHNRVALDSLAGRFYQRSPSGERTLELRVLQALAAHDTAGVDSALAALGRAPDGVLPLAAWSVAVFGQDIPAAARIVTLMTDPARPRDIRAQGHVILAHLALAQGRLSDARSELRTATGLKSVEAPLAEAWFSALPFVPMTKPELDAARARLAEWNANDSTAASTHPSAFYSSHNAVRPIIKTYLLGLLDARRGDPAGARARITELDAVANVPGGPPLAAELVQGIRAQVDLRDKHPDSALAALPGLRIAGWYELTFASPFYAGALERYTRAALLEGANHPEEAVDWYRSLGENATEELVFLGPAMLAQARIQVKLGHLGEAARLYDGFLALWSDADPALKPLVDQAKAECNMVKVP